MYLNFPVNSKAGDMRRWLGYGERAVCVLCVCLPANHILCGVDKIPEFRASREEMRDAAQNSNRNKHDERLEPNPLRRVSAARSTGTPYDALKYYTL